jgi:hypothetical protein
MTTPSASDVSAQDSSRAPRDKRPPRSDTPRSRWWIVAWVAAGVVVLLGIFAVAANSVTVARGVCGTCHETKSEVAAWKVSPHADVGCYACHGRQRPWYAFPVTSLDRVATMARYLRVHVSGGHEPGIGTAASDPAAYPDATCLGCHTLTRTVTSGRGVTIQHARHAQRNKSCISCHLWTAHPDPSRDQLLLMMTLCFNCHGRSDYPRASADCVVCHQRGVTLRPASHTTGDWLAGHGKVAKGDRRLCAMCHQVSWCTNCHGLPMPHPANWATVGHPIAAKSNRVICQQCHQGKTNLCTMCHHKGYDAGQGPWLKRHPLMVDRTGASFCMQCHEPTFCTRCHEARRATVASPAL